MSSTWRNKETNNITHKSGIPITSPPSPPENFKNIPMFEVLHPKVPSSDPSVTKEFTEEVTEGFDIMGDDYFESCKRYIRLKGLAGISDFVKDKFKLLYTNPVDKLDESIEDTIYSVLYGLLLMTGEECKDDTLLEKQTKDKAFSGFWWIKGYGSELFTTMQEAFSVQDNPYLTKTVDSFKKNHPEFITDNNIYNKVVEYYVSQLNERETKLKRRINDTELFQFNNYFDNQLNLPEVQSKILKIKTSATTQTIKTAYRNTMADYQKYYKNTARFKIYNKEPISYYTFDNTYFDLSNNTAPPESPASDNAEDKKYAFSIDFNKSETVPIESFLEDVLTHYTSILVKNKKTGSYKHNILKSRIGTVYTKLLNYLEFQFYRKYGVFFNENHLALFNHIFYILLNQDDTDAENVYNGTTNDYFNFGKQQMTNIYQTLFKEILSDESSKLSYLYPLEPPLSSGDIDMQKFYLYDYMLLKDDEMLPTDGVMLYPVSISPIVLGVNTALVLMDYILLPEPPFEVESDMKTYYTEELTECEKEQEKKKKKIKGYAKTIKEELYKIILAPVTIYIAYNFYYLFFFKDCTESVKTYNETTGDTDYKNTSDNCTTPIFPDVETYFHYYEEHKLDLLFELFFKPVKFLYTLANSLKAIFRNEFSLLSANAIVPKDEFPYIFLFACIIFFYNYLIYDFSKNEEGNYKYVLSIFNHIIGLDFDKLNESVTGLRMDQLQVNKTEDIESILKKGGIAAYVFMITILFFTETMIHHIGGVSIKSMFNNIATKAFSSDGVIDSDYKKDYENSWLFWVTNTTNPLVGILKFLYMLFYWFLKGFIVVKLIPLSVTIIILYFIYNLFVGIYNNSSTDISMFDKIELINRTIYTKLYSESSNTIMFMIKSVFWFVFFYLYEFIAILVLIISLTTILKRIDSNEITTVISMFFSFFIVGIVLWCAYKYKLIKPKLDDDYMRYDNSKQFNMFNCKDEYEKSTDNHMLNIFVASDTYNKVIIDEYMKKRKNEIINKKPSGLQKSFGSMVNFFGDKMKSAKSFLEDKTANVESTIGSGLTNVKDLLASKIEQTKDGASKLKEVAYKTPSKLGEGAYKLGEGALYGSKALGEGALYGSKALGEGALNGAKALGEGALNGAKSLATGISNLFSNNSNK
jgi:hypothetical protein